MERPGGGKASAHKKGFTGAKVGAEITYKPDVEDRTDFRVVFNDSWRLLCIINGL